MSPHALKRLNTSFKWACATTALASVFAVEAVSWPNKPLATNLTATPMTMLVAGRDHKLFYEAYNDASDIDGDGTLDTRFKPAINYFGLFDSTLCYIFSGIQSRAGAVNSDGNTGLFSPAAKADAQGRCTGSTAQWSGNWLNYVTTSRIDALRKVLYGGFREVDTTTETILRRAYIPQDAHTWAKEYTSTAVDGYAIQDYTDLTQPTASRRHFFGNLTHNAGINCATISDCSNLPPVLSVVTNSKKRVWEWASTERPVLREDSGMHGGTGPAYYTVRVRVCVPGYTNGCRQYPNGQFKPIGLLHEYGENNAMLFGLITGSYDSNMSGGLLRKVVSSFAEEVNNTTGIFTTDARIVKTFDSLRIRDFNNGRTDNAYRGGWLGDSAMTEGVWPDWGNPIAEMMYEGTRYFAGKKSATTSFMRSSRPVDGDVFGTANASNTATWDDPYDPNDSKAKAAWCAKASFLTISDINPSFDSDTLPGVASQFSTGITGDISGLNVSTLGNAITLVESNITGMRFIGQSQGVFDSAPTAKLVDSLGSIRGLSPEEPTKQGSYYSASMAYYASTNDLRSDRQKNQTVDTYSVALASPLPTIEAKLPNGRSVTVVPFAKSVGGAFNITPTKGNFQPTNQIVDFYVDTIANSGANDKDDSVNNGRYYAKFRISFEDVEQGADHDMDAISVYEVQANANNTLSIKVTPEYQAGGIQHHMGFIVSGSTQDGVYLVARDENTTGSYFLNVPAGRIPGYCDVTTPPADCATLPTIGSTIPTYTFTPSTIGAATFLKDPLWYAAKWGGFQDRNNNNRPDLAAEWDSDSDGVPDTYFLVQNPLKLQAALRRAFDSIVSRNGGGGNVVANSRALSTSTSSQTFVFQGVFDTAKWSGNLIAYPANAATGIGAASWSAAQKMPLPAEREIFYRTASATNAKKLPAATVPSDLTSHISSNDLLRYLRGDSSKELANPGGIFRDRAGTVTLVTGTPLDLGDAARLGDISHSSPVYIKKQTILVPNPVSGTGQPAEINKDIELVYVGANDGMLHAFDAKTGVEKFAFVPSAVLPRLKNLAGLGYNEQHEFFVDGDIAISTRTQTIGKNHLVAALGRGGKGLFGLDVSNVGTSGFAETDTAWEYFDTTDADLGYMLGRPIITQLENNQWVAIVGNGYESTSGHAALYVFNLGNGALLHKFTLSSAGTGNGMATPGTFDSNNNGRTDVVYAGDLKGNVWKFDVSKFDVSKTVGSEWAVANGGKAIFVAEDAAGKLQPITAPATAAKNTVTGDPNAGQVHVFFGTGSYFRAVDPANKDTQTWYSIIDRTATTATTLLRANMLQRSVLATGVFDGKPVRTFQQSEVGDLLNKDGCFTDLPESGERIVTASNLFRLAEPTLIASSIIPIVDQCVPGGTGYVNAINPFTCGRLSKPFFDVNNNTNFNDDVLGGNFIGSLDLGVGMPGEAIIVGNRLIVGGSDGTLKSVRINSGSIRAQGRISWREIIRD
jgi:type IV pilus assembly protein PilY1